MFFINTIGEYFIGLLSGLGLKSRATRPKDLPAGHLWRSGAKLYWYDGSSDLELTVGSSGMPIGSIICYGAASAPSGWLLCDGSVVSRTTYAGLFAVVGTVFGAGDGSTTFQLPDLRGRSPLGHEASSDHDIGETGGSASVDLSHTHGVGSLANAAEASHTHGVGSLANAAETSHTHTYTVSQTTFTSKTYRPISLPVPPRT